MSKLVPIDFEFNSTAEPRLNLVCASYSVDGKLYNHWLLNRKDNYEVMKKHLLKLRDENYIFVAFNVIAEAQSFIALGIDPTKCRWIDLQQEWKMLTNHYHKYSYGKHLIKGKEVTTFPPKYGEDTGISNAKAPKNLAGCLYKLLDVKVDTEHKDLMRNIIIRNNYDEIMKHQKDIQLYCDSDIDYLLPALSKVREAYADYFKTKWKYTKEELAKIDITDYKNEPIEVTRDEILYRGETASRTAMMQSVGYPVSVAKVSNFAKNVPKLLRDLAEDINSQFSKDEQFFKYNKREDKYSVFQAPLKKWIEESEYAEKWIRTKPSKTKPEGDWSLKTEAWEKHFSYRHEFPRNNLPAQLMRYLKVKQSLNGFLPKSRLAKNKETFFNSLGSDGRVRSYLNPYGAQSGRFQPKATSFIPLKSAWMRSMIQPKLGRSICAIDYGSQEFLISALFSNDKNMIQAYKSGDVYLYFAKLAGAVPMDGKREDYEQLRDVFKSTTLGISYSMGASALSAKLTLDTGKKHTVQDAKDLISKFEDAFPDYANTVRNIRYSYDLEGYIKLADGFTMFGDNDNARSISNMPIQGFGSCILRKAIQLCQESKLQVIFPLHDALYIEYKTGDLKALRTFKECMREAFAFYFKGDLYKQALELIRLDLNVWGPGEVEGSFELDGENIKTQKIYVDSRSKTEYEKFKQYMEG